MADKSRRSGPKKKAAYTARRDQGSDPKPPSPIVRKLRSLLPPKNAPKPHADSREPDGALYAYDKQKALAYADAPDVARIEAQPFLKWVGGKSQLLAQFDRFFSARIDRYFEPFIGGGAVFFHLKTRFPLMCAHLRDNNSELINCFTIVRDNPHDLMRHLDQHIARYRADHERYYYLIRSQHNLADPLDRAARMVFLNKTCFNGLWRVNARGEFNVPIGSHKDPALYDRDNLLAASWALRNVHLATQDFRATLAEARQGDFVYVDPPYYPLSPTASFTSYTKEDFGPEEQQELAALFAEAAGRGARLMLSNSDTEFVRKLYHGFVIHTVKARRAINCNGLKRGGLRSWLSFPTPTKRHADANAIRSRLGKTHPRAGGHEQRHRISHQSRHRIRHRQ